MMATVEVEREFLAFMEEKLAENPKPEVWTIENDSQAEYALRKIRHEQYRQEEIRAYAQQQIAMIEEWQRKQLEQSDNTVKFFEWRLKDYLERRAADDPKFKGLKLPTGKAALKEQAPEYIRDEAKLLNWLKENDPELIKVVTKESPDWASLKSRLQVIDGLPVDTETGAIIEGVAIQERPPKLEIKFN